ncbi:MAG TPA: GNAT family N-acetyltransferase [Thermomicrobiales bacterium]|nr:GNAT family N-acetyltransferase [Thermomicrobiales bacterium]
MNHQDDIHIRPAQPREADALSRLAMRSKAHWGYDQSFLDACRDDLTVLPERCDGTHLMLAETDGVMAGWVEVRGDPPVGELANLWVDPSFMGKSIGKALWNAALDLARSLAFTELNIDSDPHAEGFYRHMGATRIGETRSTVYPDRRLPLMKVTL